MSRWEGGKSVSSPISPRVEAVRTSETRRTGVSEESDLRKRVDPRIAQSKQARSTVVPRYINVWWCFFFFFPLLVGGGVEPHFLGPADGRAGSRLRMMLSPCSLHGMAWVHSGLTRHDKVRDGAKREMLYCRQTHTHTHIHVHRERESTG